MLAKYDCFYLLFMPILRDTTTGYQPVDPFFESIYGRSHLATRQTALLPLLTAALLLALGSSASAGKSSKVSLCHANGEGDLHVIRVSENALRAHSSHGDLLVGVDVDENCAPLLQEEDYCIEGSFSGYYNEYFQVTHDPATGNVVGDNVTYGGPLYGSISPIGVSALDGVDYEFTNDASYGTWFGAGSNSGGGGYVGSWWAPWGVGPATYTFTPGTCF